VAESPELQEAVYELHQYLSDRIAPLMFADSMGVLLQYPAQVVASEIQKWVVQQSSVAQGIPLADFLFHAVKKVSLIGEFDLVPKDVLGKYLTELGGAVLAICPEGDRELLGQNLAQLGHATGVETATPVEVLHRRSASSLPGAGSPVDPALSREVAVGLRRLSLFLERLRHPMAAQPEQRTEVASQFMTAAAVQASSDQELAAHLEHLRQIGIETEPDKVIRAIAQSLPGWVLPPGSRADAPAGQMSAIRQIVSLAEDPAEHAKRFRELVHAAIEQFNEGHLGRAATMFELAEQLAADKKVQAVYVDALRKSGDEYLDAARLRKLSERADARPSLSSVLRFFHPLQPEGLLSQLDGEPRRERRHELLTLLEVHGLPARARAYEMLKASIEDPNAPLDPFFQMNLVYLLRVVPRPPDASVEEEIAIVMRTPGKASPPPQVKQVIAYLAATHHEKAERALITYLRVFENMLLQPETAVYPPADIDTLLERTCAALARYGTPRAWRALVDHGLKTEVRLGSPLSRLVEAGKQDLSSSKDLVDRLLAALKGELPRPVLGISVRKSPDRIVWLIQALSGTPTPEVRQAFQEIREKHSGQPFAEAATKALAGLDAAGRPSDAALTGDLDLFGLPGLLQTLGQGTLTGVLTLMDASGRSQATLQLERGGLRGAQFGALRGDDAVYQLLERPFPGSFAFVSRQQPSSPSASKPEDVTGLILEGVRRHDELKRSAALVPDAARLAPTGASPTPPAGEDEDFVDVVWKSVAGGATVAECEAAIATDSFAIRRVLAQWVEEGSLRMS
jgi:hypothetical protein